MTTAEIEAIAADAENLRHALAVKGFSQVRITEMLTTSMPAIIACETGTTRYADAP
jgi:hypothetical protein